MQQCQRATKINRDASYEKQRYLEMGFEVIQITGKTFESSRLGCGCIFLDQLSFAGSVSFAIDYPPAIKLCLRLLKTWLKV